jgi:hypothetical protein
MHDELGLTHAGTQWTTETRIRRASADSQDDTPFNPAKIRRIRAIRGLFPTGDWCASRERLSSRHNLIETDQETTTC